MFYVRNCRIKRDSLIRGIGHIVEDNWFMADDIHTPTKPLPCAVGKHSLDRDRKQE